MPYDPKLAERVRPLFARQLACVEKKMFGGVGFLLYGNMCIGVWKEFLIVRTGPDAYEDALQQPHVREFDITGKTLSNWVMIEPDGIESDANLTTWVRLAQAFVKTLPAK